jgi:DNA-binding response OmpR family regulator
VNHSLPDLFLIDIHVPKPDGVTLYKVFQQAPQTRDIPAILMTGEDVLESILGAAAEGLKSEPVLRKPMDAGILLKRVQRALDLKAVRAEGGKSAPKPRCHALDGLKFYPDSCRLIVGDEAVILNHKESILLEVFLRRPNVLHSQESLWSQGWPSSDAEDWRHALDIRISSLRGKLGEKWGPRLECRKKLGFIFCTEGK